MTHSDIEKALMEVISEIQDGSGLDCPQLTGSVIPADEVPSFDSKVWLVATTMLSSKIEAEIPASENIFIDNGSKEALSIDKICKLVSRIVAASKSSEQAA